MSAWTPQGSAYVYINAALLSTAFGDVNQGLLLHEMLHDVYGLDDGQIMQALQAYDPGARIDPNGPSSQITRWMTTNCVDGRGNN